MLDNKNNLIKFILSGLYSHPAQKKLLFNTKLPWSFNNLLSLQLYIYILIKYLKTLN